jgi:hypothetical protein
MIHGRILPIDELIFFKMVIAPPTSYVLFFPVKFPNPVGEIPSTSGFLGEIQ